MCGLRGICRALSRNGAVDRPLVNFIGRLGWCRTVHQILPKKGSLMSVYLSTPMADLTLVHTFVQDFILDFLPLPGQPSSRGPILVAAGFSGD
jgi:hypothetical protein